MVLSAVGAAAPWPVEVLAERCADLCEASDRLAGIAGRLAEVASNDRIAVALARVSRYLGEHAAWWSQHQPESVLLADRRAEGATGPMVDASNQLGVLAPAAVDLGAFRDVLFALSNAVAALAGGCSDEAGAPFRRVAGWVGSDLDSAIAELSVL